jgi:hypothetical protein
MYITIFNTSVVLFFTVVYVLIYVIIGALIGLVQAVFGYYIISHIQHVPYDFVTTLYASILGNITVSLVSVSILIMICSFIHEELDSENILELLSNYFLLVPFLIIDGICAFLAGYGILHNISATRYLVPVYNLDAITALGSGGGFFSSVIILCSLIILRLLYLICLKCIKTCYKFLNRPRDLKDPRDSRDPEDLNEKVDLESNTSSISIV